MIDRSEASAIARLRGRAAPCEAAAEIMTRPLHILVVGDGKPGHENQSCGLAEAVGRRIPVRQSLVRIDPEAPVWRRVAHALARAPDSAPDLLIAAGHATHLPLLALARRSGAPCVLLMKPSLPAALFDLCLIPRHDLEHRGESPGILATTGALNRVAPPTDTPRPDGLILIGGPSASHGWDPDALIGALGAILNQDPQRPWHITDSRRTPQGFLPSLASRFPHAHLHPHTGTGRDWLPARLARSGETWVTEDSVSMIYEALSSGSRVGLLPAPRLRSSSRVLRGIDRLATDGFATPFARWLADGRLHAPPHVLREADRCAATVLHLLFPTLS